LSPDVLKEFTPRQLNDLRREMERVRRNFEKALPRFFPERKSIPPLLFRAMRYSTFSGGKRLRPILLILTGKACGEKITSLLPAAAAVEFVHTYSLIHDDLPSMDDDDLRRGRPTSHRVFGEGPAILAGDALLTLAFQTLSSHYEGGLCRRLTSELSFAAGAAGMVGGQVLDIESERKGRGPRDVREIHMRKTAALIAASVCMGAIVAGASEKEIAILTRYGRKIGLVFQIIDDIMDEEKEVGTVGKATGKDRARGKMTYPTVFGIDGSRRRAEKLTREALRALEGMPRLRILRALALLLLERQR